MTSWLWWGWGQVWPNLVANILWLPVVAIYHRSHRQLKAEVLKLTAELRDAL